LASSPAYVNLRMRPCLRSCVGNRRYFLRLYEVTSLNERRKSSQFIRSKAEFLRSSAEFLRSWFNRAWEIGAFPSHSLFRRVSDPSPCLLAGIGGERHSWGWRTPDRTAVAERRTARKTVRKALI